MKKLARKKSFKYKKRKNFLAYAISILVLAIIISLTLLFYNGSGPLAFLSSSASINAIDKNCKPGQACWGAALNMLGQFKNSQESKNIAAAQKEIDKARKEQKEAQAAGNAEDVASAKAAEAAAIAKQKAAKTALANNDISNKIEVETGYKVKTAEESLADIKANSTRVTGGSCPGANSSIASGQYAQSGRNATKVTGSDGKLGTETQRECVKCQDGEWSGSFICGEGEASSYITRPDEVLDCKQDINCVLANKIHASCWRDGVWYADSAGNGGDHCFDGQWKSPEEYKDLMAGTNTIKGRCGELGYNESTFRCNERVTIPGSSISLTPAQVAKIAECAGKNTGVINGYTACDTSPRCESGWQLKPDGSSCVAPTNQNTPEVKSSIEACTKNGRYFDYGTGLCHADFNSLSEIGKANNERHLTVAEKKKLERDCHIQHPGYFFTTSNTCIPPNSPSALFPADSEDNQCIEGLTNLNGVKVYTTCKFEGINSLRGITTYHFCTAGDGTQEYVQGVGCVNTANPKNSNGNLTGGETPTSPDMCKYGTTGNVCNYSTGSLTKPGESATAESQDNPGRRKVAKATDCNPATEKVQATGTGGGIYCILIEPSQSDSNNNQPKIFGETCSKNSECGSDMCSLKTNSSKGTGWYCMDNINKTDTQLEAGILTDHKENCKNGGVDTGFVTHTLLKSYPIYECLPAPVETPVLDTTPLVPVSQEPLNQSIYLLSPPVFDPAIGKEVPPEAPEKSAQVNDRVINPDQCESGKVAVYNVVYPPKFLCMSPDYSCNGEDRSKGLFCAPPGFSSEENQTKAFQIFDPATINSGKADYILKQGQLETTGGIDIDYIRQQDYANVINIDGSNWADTGCGVMAGAMVFSTITGNSDPVAYNAQIEKYGYVTSTGTGWFIHKTILEENGFGVVPVYGSVAEKEKQILEYASEGVPVWINAYIDNGTGSYIGHHTLVVGVDAQGSLILDDPYFGENYHMPIERFDIDCSKSGTLNDEGKYECKNHTTSWFVNAIVPPEN